jgi:hypothetical protein
MNNNYIYFTPNNKKTNDLLIKNNITDKTNIEGKILKKNNEFIWIGFGVYSNMTPSYSEKKTNIKWCASPKDYTPEICKSFKKLPHQIIKFDINGINKDFTIKKRTPIYPSIGDDVIIKINEKYISNLTDDYLKKIVDIIKTQKDGLKCKVLTYNLWDPPCSKEIIVEDCCTGFTKCIPGCILLGSGIYNKYKIPMEKNQYEFLSHNLFPITDLTKVDKDNNIIFTINNSDLYFFEFYILK